jgi:hypothetical protein
MRCKNCDHTLWNQPVPPEGTERKCSECGAPYALAEFEFARGRFPARERLDDLRGGRVLLVHPLDRT